MNSEDSDSEDDIEDTATQAKTKSAFQEKVRGGNSSSLYSIAFRLSL